MVGGGKEWVARDWDMTVDEETARLCVHITQTHFGPLTAVCALSHCHSLTNDA